jgi:hypothetical protein
MCWALSLSRLVEIGPRPALSSAGAGRVGGFFHILIPEFWSQASPSWAMTVQQIT